MTDTNRAVDTSQLESAAKNTTQLRQAVKRGKSLQQAKEQKDAVTTAETQQQIAADLQVLQAPADASTAERLEIESLRAQLAATQEQLKQQQATHAGYVHSSFRQATGGDDHSVPIAVIDEYGMVHPFTTNNNDRIALLKMNLQYIYTQEDLKEAIARANRIQRNEADVNTQMVGAKLSRAVGQPKGFKDNQNGMRMDFHTRAVDPRKLEVRNDPSHF